MRQTPHQLMGYDRAITMFSPDGRLLQVEYAKKTVKQGSTAMGFVCKDGVLLIADKRVLDPLMVTKSLEKIWQVDSHIGIAASGILSDARVLVENAQLKAQQNNITYDSPSDVLTIVKSICDLKQMTTQSGGLRPFGVSLLVAGVDIDGPKLFETDPTGIYFEYQATAIGEWDEKAKEILYKKYKKNLTIEDAMKLGILILKTVLDKEFNLERIDAVAIKTVNAEFVRITMDELKEMAK